MYCSLCVARCALLFVVWSMLFAVDCYLLLSVVARCVLFVVAALVLHVVVCCCCLLFVIC